MLRSSDALRRSVWRRAVVAIAVVLAVPAGARASSPPAPGAPVVGPPLTQPSCYAVNPAVRLFAVGVPLLDWREELVFDRLGGLWVSRLERNVVERYDPTGAVGVTVSVPGPGGLALGPDGLVYVNSLDNSGGPADVYRFDPRLAQPVATPFVTSLPGVNGSAFDPSGNLYISTEGAAPSVLRIRPDGTRDLAWEQQAAFYGANGVAIAGGDLYAAVSFDQQSPIELVPIDDPAAHRRFALLSFGVLSKEPAVYPPNPGAPLIPKGLDDLTIGPDGAIYVVGFSSGELLRVDRRTGDACVVVGGLTAPTAVQFPVAFGSFDRRHDAFVTEAAGNVVEVSLPG